MNAFPLPSGTGAPGPSIRTRADRGMGPALRAAGRAVESIPLYLIGPVMMPVAQPPRIACVDIDAAFCQAAYLTWPERLAGVELLLVGGHPERRGIVASCTYAARARGIHSAMPMATALRICPEATAVPVPWSTVRRKAREVFSVLGRFALRLERASIDEAYLLLPEDGEPFGDICRRMREAVLEETGITVSIGGASRRFLAKMATAHAKPKPGSGGTGVHVVPPGEEYGFVGRSALGDIPGVGPAFLRALEKRGVQSVASARKIDLDTLALWVGPARARFLHDRVRGIGAATVAEAREPRKSISAEETFVQDLQEMEALEREMEALVADVGRTLRKEELRARTISVKLRGSDFQDRQKNRTLPHPIETDPAIGRIARGLLAEVRKIRPGPIRLLGLTLSSLEGPDYPEQLTFPEIIPPLETEEERRRAREGGA